jgi:hypothetical protein
MERSYISKADISHAVKTYLELYGKQNFIAYSQKTATDVYPEPDESSPHPPIRFL